MTPEEISFKVIGAAFKVHNELGPGLLERIYEQAMIIQLREDGLNVQSQVSVPVTFHGYDLGEGCRLDLVVEDTVIVELKSVETTTSVHHKQLLTYLQVTGLPIGLLINFNVAWLKQGISRKLNNYQISKHSEFD